MAGSHIQRDQALDMTLRKATEQRSFWDQNRCLEIVETIWGAWKSFGPTGNLERTFSILLRYAEHSMFPGLWAVISSERDFGDRTVIESFLLLLSNLSPLFPLLITVHSLSSQTWTWIASIFCSIVISVSGVSSFLYCISPGKVWSYTHHYQNPFHV